MPDTTTDAPETAAPHVDDAAAAAPKGKPAKAPPAAKSRAGWHRLTIVDDPADGTVPRKMADGTTKAVPVRAPRDYYSVFGRLFARETYHVYPDEVDDQGATRRDRQKGSLVLLDEGEADRIWDEVTKRRFVEWTSKKANTAAIRTLSRTRVPDASRKEGFRIAEASEQTPGRTWKPLASYLRLEFVGDTRPEQ